MSRAAETTPARFLAINEGTGFMARQIEGDERAGFAAFFSRSAEGFAICDDGVAWERGHDLAAQVAFAQGAIAAQANDGTVTVNPYRPFSPPAEAWRCGFNAMASKALDIED